MPNAHSDPHQTRDTLFFRLKADAPGRELAWREFYEQYAPIISGFCRKMGVRPHDTHDLVQDVIMGFFAVSPEFVYDPAAGRFRGYLKTCTWRIFQRRLGKQLRIGGRSLESVDQNEIQVESTWNDVWESEKLQRALARVRDRYLARPDKAKTYRAFEMYVLLERDAETVAKDLNMSLDSVHQAKSRVSKALRIEMDALSETVD